MSVDLSYHSHFSHRIIRRYRLAVSQHGFELARPFQGVRKQFQGFGRKTARSKHAEPPDVVLFQERLAQSTQLHDALIEILLTIFDHLNTASLVSLQSTCKFLQGSIDIDPKALDRCTRWLVMGHFEKDVRSPSSDHSSPLLTHPPIQTLRAASLNPTPPPATLCKTAHPHRNSLRHLLPSPNLPKGLTSTPSSPP